MKKIYLYRLSLFIIANIYFTHKIQAQTSPGEQSFIQMIIRQDSLFWNAYNQCDTAREGRYLTEDVAFYHDKGGITNGKKALLESLKKNLCSNPQFSLRRIAKAGSVKVYPLQNNGVPYGAFITGEHFFYITQNGQPEFRDGHARFTELWILSDGSYKMKQIMSYDHGPAAKGD